MVSILLPVIYLAFISLGLPDALLGSVWPIMQAEFGVPVSYAGIIFGTIAAGTIISSLLSDRLLQTFGTGGVTAVSVGMTAAALLGFSFSTEYWQLFLWAVPYGLGAGSVDASLNHYVALHYKSRHMSWLHCMWGLGASAGPYVMSSCLTSGAPWNMGYRVIGLLQVGLTAFLFLSLPLWRAKSDGGQKADEIQTETLSLWQVFFLPGAKQAMVLFFCYCALEQTVGLWASSYLVLHHGILEETAASFASLFFAGITLGRFFSGFLTFRLNDRQMVQLGQGVIALGIAAMVVPFGPKMALAGLLLIGLGCAPIYPSMLHSTPEHFGEEKSQSIFGVQMASAYIGTLCMPPLFGLVANHISVSLLPVYLLVILCVMVIMHRMLCGMKKKPQMR